MKTEQQKADIKKWADEYNALQTKGADIWAELKTMADRMRLLRDSIDEIDPNCYDQVALLFGAELEVDL